jgi:very-short-patch-repair endonuclease
MEKEKEIEFSKNLKLKYNIRIIYQNEQPFTLYNSKDIGDILNLKNIIKNLRNFNTYLISTKTNGGNQKMTYINLEDLLKIIHNTKKLDILKFADKLNLKILNYIKPPIEIETLNYIKKAFDGEKFIFQYNILDFFVDLYLPDYNLVIECDEEHHLKKENILNDLHRELKITFFNKNIKFIRYKPYDKNFCIFNLINKIYKYIKMIKIK